MAKKPSEAASYYGDYNCDLPPWTLDKVRVGLYSGWQFNKTIGPMLLKLLVCVSQKGLSTTIQMLLSQVLVINDLYIVKSPKFPQ